MGYPKLARFEAVREVAAVGVGVNYSAIGTSASSPIRMARIQNSTNAEVYISFDGVTNHLRLVAGSFILLDYTANKVRDEGFFMEEGTVFYVKRVAGAATTGSVIIEVVVGR